MENAIREHFEDEIYDYPEEIEEIDEAEIVEEEPKLDAKTWRKACFVKHRKSRIKETKKSQMSKIAQKRKKEEQRSMLGTSILKSRKWQYNAIKAKRNAAQTT